MLLDASQAFDRVNITKRFNMLIENGLSPVVVPLLITLYIKQVMGVKWKSRKGNFVTVTHRVKQGSIISPALFAMYFEKYREGNEKQSLYKKGVNSNVFCVDTEEELQKRINVNERHFTCVISRQNTY